MARTAVLVGAVGIIALVAVRGPGAGLLVLAGLAAAVAAGRLPEYALALGGLASLAGGSFGFIAAGGGLALVGCACISGGVMLARRAAPPWRRLLLPALILAWLGLRVGLEGDREVLADVVRCAAALVLVLDCLLRRRNLVWAMGMGGAVFLAVSAVFGVDDPTGTRFEGVSGNPNRMAFGLLLLLPFFCVMLLRTRRTTVRALALVLVVGAAAMIVRSGSFQGLVGLVVVTLVLLYCWATRWPAWARIVACCTSLMAVILLIGPASTMVNTSPDLVTLSGRTPIYLAAVDEIMQSPFVGSGRQHFSGDGVVDRSAHSVVLALAATGGLALGLAWVAVLVVLIVLAGRMAKAGNPLAAVPVAFTIEQFVQTIHLVPFAWAVVGMLLIMRRPGDLLGRSWGDPAGNTADQIVPTAVTPAYPRWRATSPLRPATWALAGSSSPIRKDVR